jgi:hypothetical protein
MTADLQNKLLSLCDSFPNQLRAIPVDKFNVKPPNKWSKKEILGHLIDSATVNLQRFVRGQLEDNPQIYYAQDDWVAIQDYQHCDDVQLIALWESLNRHLVYVISRIAEGNLTKTCQMRNRQDVTLLYLAEDYIVHLEHHIEQILAYS